MIVDLHLRGGLVIVVGAGAEGLKKINSLLTQDCRILVMAQEANPQVLKYAAAKKIRFKKTRLDDAKILDRYRPYLVMATTDDRALNRRLVRQARKMGCMAYASDDPDASDFAHPSVINIADAVQVAVSTGGRSPAMAQKIRMRAQKVFEEIVTPEDIGAIKLQDEARREAKKSIRTQKARKLYLYRVINDPEIKQLIKEGKASSAKRRAMRILKESK